MLNSTNWQWHARGRFNKRFSNPERSKRLAYHWPTQPKALPRIERAEFIFICSSPLSFALELHFNLVVASCNHATSMSPEQSTSLPGKKVPGSGMVFLFRQRWISE